MRWATYRAKSGGPERVGLVLDDKLHALPEGTTLIGLLGDDGTRLRLAGEQARNSPAAVDRLSEVQLLSPIPQPATVRDFVSFEAHHRAGIEAIGQKWSDSYYEFPMFYFTNAAGLIGHGAPVRIPGNTRRMDYELELACVIGREGIDIAPEDAESYIAGYTIFNDWSARDLQSDEMARAPIGPAKGKDSAISVGPYLVTPDELEDARSGNGYRLAMTATVNGEEFSRGSWDSIYWSFAEMVAYASRNCMLKVGDVLGSGTVGTGCLLEFSFTSGKNANVPWLKEGDEVALTVERLGTLANRVERAPDPKPIRGRITGERALSLQG